MARALVLALAAVVPARALNAGTALSADFSDDAWKVNPVSKVVHLLQDMQDQIAKEQEEDQKTFDLMACWCETNDKLKTKEIAAAQARLSDLGTTIEELTATSSQLTTDIATLEDEIASGTAALKESKAIRAGDKAEFEDEDTESKRIVSGLTGAVDALKKHHGQAEEAPAEAPAALLEARRSARVVRSTAGQPVAASSYSSQSGQIFGVLGAMKDEFSENLAKAQAGEAAAAGDFAKLSTSKASELAASKAQLKEKQVERADAKEDLANAKNDEVDTSAQLKLDVAFLADLKQRCAAMDKEWEMRQAQRNDEATAVSEAISILSDDEAKDLAHKSVGSFLQVKSVQATRRAATLLRKTSAPSGYAAMLQEEPAAAAPAGNGTNSEVFHQLQVTIRKLVANRKNATEEEVIQKDYCTEKLQENEKLMTAEHGTKEDIEGKIDDLNAQLATIKSQLEADKAEEKSSQLQLLAAGQNRGKENLAFQMMRVDQRATQEVLAKALAKLQAFYSKKGATLTQMQKADAADAALRHAQAQAPPPGFKPYKKAGGNGGVVGFLQNIIAESEEMEKEGILAEQEAQAAFEQFTSDTSATLKALATSIADASDEKAKADGALVVAKDQLATALKNLYDLTEINKGLHQECDYTLNGFDERQEKRLQEIEALQHADQMLSGSVA